MILTEEKRKISIPVSVCPPQMSHRLTWGQIRTSVPRPSCSHIPVFILSQNIQHSFLNIPSTINTCKRQRLLPYVVNSHHGYERQLSFESHRQIAIVEDRNTCMLQHLLVEAVTGRVGAVTSGCLPPCWRLKSTRNWVFG